VRAARRAARIAAVRAGAQAEVGLRLSRNRTSMLESDAGLSRAAVGRSLDSGGNTITVFGALPFIGALSGSQYERARGREAIRRYLEAWVEVQTWFAYAQLARIEKRDFLLVSTKLTRFDSLAFPV